MLKQIKVTAPSHWASYFINGDASGLETEEQLQADKFLKRQGLGSPVSCEDAGFMRWHDAAEEMPLAADCQEYLFLYQEPPKLPVIFKKHYEAGKWEVTAFFPTLPATNDTMTCYAHIGQHSGASFGYFHAGKKASEAEYSDLLRELRGIYERGPLAEQSRLVVKQRMSPGMRKAFKEACR